MNNLSRYLQILTALCAVTACTLGKQVNSAKEQKRIHALDSLPVTIIESEAEVSDTTVFMDTTSSVFQKEILFSSLGNSSMTSESCKIDINKDEPFQIKELNHIKFQDLKIAVDDFRIINYLTSDF